MSSGVIYSILSILTMFLSMTGHGKLASWLHDPNTVQNIGVLISSGLALAAGVSQGVAKPAVAKTEVVIDPNGYPGWIWDSMNGWVPDPNFKPNNKV